MNRRYLLISPGRNEANYMRHTLDSVIAQSVQPARWVIVDDCGPPPRAVLLHLC
jgi:poly-beta-1,6-N-acetyl-D-glucosamine synthase